MTTVVDVLWSVKPPAAIMTRERSALLTARERQILNDLVEIFKEGFAHLTMADLALRLSCSMRTLYGLATNRDELFLIVNDRVMRSYGYAAKQAITPDMSGVEAARIFLHGCNQNIRSYSEPFARDLAAFAPGSAREREYFLHAVAVVRELLDFAVEQGEIPSVDTFALAIMLGSAARTFDPPDVESSLLATSEATANAMADLVLDGLRTRTNGGRPADSARRPLSRAR